MIPLQKRAMDPQRKQTTCRAGGSGAVSHFDDDVSIDRLRLKSPVFRS